MGRSDLHDSGGHPDRRLDGAISDEVRRWLRVDEVGRITRANGVTSTSAIPYCRAIRSSVLLYRTTLVTLAPTPTTPFRRKPGAPGKPTAAAALPHPGSVSADFRTTSWPQG